MTAVLLSLALLLGVAVVCGLGVVLFEWLLDLAYGIRRRKGDQ